MDIVLNLILLFYKTCGSFSVDIVDIHIYILPPVLAILNCNCL